MLCFISDQVMPNFIPVNEPTTRPDVLYAVYTFAPRDPNKPTDSECKMKHKFATLKYVVEQKFPRTRVVPVELKDEYDTKTIYDRCESLLNESQDDAWSLNATGGTKLMSAPAFSLFHARNKDVIYVETGKSRMVKVNSNWIISEVPFTGSIDVEKHPVFMRLPKGTHHIYLHPWGD